MRSLAVALSVCASVASAQGYSEPARGSALRADLLAAVRPLAEWTLGPPVEFVVLDLRVSGDAAFASLIAQRPGGGEIDLAQTPGAARSDLDPAFMDGSTVQALLVRSGPGWVAVQHAIGPTDVWYAWDIYCPIWSKVLPGICP